MSDDHKHIGYPLPSEMFHTDIIPTVDIDEEWRKHTAYSELLDIPLKLSLIHI